MTGEFSGSCIGIAGADRGMGAGVDQVFGAAGAMLMPGARTLSHAEDAVATIHPAGGVCGNIEFLQQVFHGESNED